MSWKKKCAGCVRNKETRARKTGLFAFPDRFFFRLEPAAVAVTDDQQRPRQPEQGGNPPDAVKRGNIVQKDFGDHEIDQPESRFDQCPAAEGCNQPQTAEDQPDGGISEDAAVVKTDSRQIKPTVKGKRQYGGNQNERHECRHADEVVADVAVGFKSAEGKNQHRRTIGKQSARQEHLNPVEKGRTAQQPEREQTPEADGENDFSQKAV